MRKKKLLIEKNFSKFEANLSIQWKVRTISEVFNLLFQLTVIILQFSNHENFLWECSIFEIWRWKIHNCYSRNKIRKAQNEHLNIVFQKFNANFLTFRGLYHLLFDVETFGARFKNHHLRANNWEKVVSLLVGNLNSGLVI